MDAKLQSFIEKSLAEKKGGSVLNEYAEEIEELRKYKISYGKIAEFLLTEKKIKISGPAIRGWWLRHQDKKNIEVPEVLEAPEAKKVKLEKKAEKEKIDDSENLDKLLNE